MPTITPGSGDGVGYGDECFVWQDLPTQTGKSLFPITEMKLNSQDTDTWHVDFHLFNPQIQAIHSIEQYHLLPERPKSTSHGLTDRLSYVRPSTHLPPPQTVDSDQQGRMYQ